MATSIKKEKLARSKTLTEERGEKLALGKESYLGGNIKKNNKRKVLL
jgi:hypothetical protein